MTISDRKASGPTHPELLDWLASEFLHPEWHATGTHNWDVKHLIRTIVLSHTYRQSSMSAPALEEKDPDNRLLARQSRMRVDAEVVHDIALDVSGLLVEKFGGPSVRPYQPDGYLATLNFPKREYAASHGGDLYRRGLYTFWQRSFLHPTLVTFDAPTREECTVNRVNSDTPLQALDLLNDPIYVEASRVFAQHILGHGHSVPEQLDWAFVRALGRKPSAEERRTLEGLYRKNLARFQAEPASAQQLTHVGEAPVATQEHSGRARGNDDCRAGLAESARGNYKKLARGIEMGDFSFMNADIRRRTFLGRGAAGLGLVALNTLLNPKLFAATADAQPARWRGIVQPLHFPPKAKRVIFLYQAGGPSHLETFDNKPKLREMNDKEMPESFTKGQQIAQLQGKKLICFGPQYEFRKFGKSGQEICELFPQIGGIADDICIVRSMWTEQINHDPAHTVMNTGSIIPGRPSMGSWLVYGLGSEAADLPGFVVLMSAGKGGQMQPIASRQWSAGLLPSKFQGVKLNSIGDAVMYIDNPPGIDKEMQSDEIAAINALNRMEHDAVRDPEILTRVAQYEMAFQMQSSVPGLVDVSKEPKEVMEMYGAKPGDGSFASNCLLARRLAERGVRFIQLYHRDWDHHSGLKKNVALKAEEVDRPTSALIQDLKQRGMLDDTLVVFGGEFGRTPMSQSGDGRDHHIKGFSYMLAGARHQKRHHSTEPPPTILAMPQRKIPSACTIFTPRCSSC